MTILNQELEWREVVLQDHANRNAFRGLPVKALLPPGTLLSRFITSESKKKGILGNETFKSPWWMDWSSAFAEIKRWHRPIAPSKKWSVVGWQ